MSRCGIFAFRFLLSRANEWRCYIPVRPLKPWSGRWLRYSFGLEAHERVLVLSPQLSNPAGYWQVKSRPTSCMSEKGWQTGLLSNANSDWSIASACGQPSPGSADKSKSWFISDVCQVPVRETCGVSTSFSFYQPPGQGQSFPWEGKEFSPRSSAHRTAEVGKKVQAETALLHGVGTCPVSLVTEEIRQPPLPGGILHLRGRSGVRGRRGPGGSGKVSKENAPDSPPCWRVRKKPEKTRAEAPMTSHWPCHTCPCTHIPGTLGPWEGGRWAAGGGLRQLRGLQSLSPPLCHSLVREERSYCKEGNGKTWASVWGDSIWKHFPLYANPLEKHGVQPTSWRNPCYIRVQPKTNKNLEPQWTISWPWICKAASVLLVGRFALCFLQTETIARRLNCRNFDAI